RTTGLFAIVWPCRRGRTGGRMSSNSSSSRDRGDAPSPRQGAGSDWLEPQATIAVRTKPPFARAKLAATAAVLFAIAYAVFRFTGQSPAADEPLSFFLEEQKPDDTGMRFVHEIGSFAPFFDNVKPFMRAVSASACTADVDGDGDLDVFMTTAGDG